MRLFRDVDTGVIMSMSRYTHIYTFKQSIELTSIHLTNNAWLINRQVWTSRAEDFARTDKLT